MPRPRAVDDDALYDLARRMRVLRAEGLTIADAAERLGIDEWTAARLPAPPSVGQASRAELVRAAAPWMQKPWSAKDVP